jgi:hypothetical protein
VPLCKEGKGNEKNKTQKIWKQSGKNRKYKRIKKRKFQFLYHLNSKLCWPKRVSAELWADAKKFGPKTRRHSKKGEAMK